MIKFTKDDTQECSDNHILSINLWSFSTTILTIYDNDNSDDSCHWTFYFSSTRIYKTKLEYILILTYKYDMYTYYVFIYDVVVIHFRNQK